MNKVTTVIEKMALALDQPKISSNLLNSKVACMVCKDVISDEECKALTKASLSRRMSYLGKVLHSKKNAAGESLHAIEMAKACHKKEEQGWQILS